MDDLAQEQIRLASSSEASENSNNNYWVYSIIEAIRDDAAISVLEQRRDNACNDCDRDQLLQDLQRQILG